MPQPPSVTAAEVDHAVTALLADGQYPTSARLRVALGNKGSPVTIQRLLAQWYADHGKAFAERVAAHAERATDTVRARLEAAAQDAIASFDAAQAERVSAMDARESELAQRDDALRARELDLEKRENAQSEVIQRTTDALASSRKELVDAKAAAARLDAELAAARASVADLGERAERAESTVRDLQAVRGELQAVRGEAERLRARTDEDAAARDAALANAAALIKQAETAVAETAIVQSALTGAKARTAELATLVEVRDSELETLRATVAELRERAAVERKRASTREVAMESALSELRGTHEVAAGIGGQLTTLAAELSKYGAAAESGRVASRGALDSVAKVLGRVDSKVADLVGGRIIGRKEAAAE
ncbi:MAG TPA: DNA-binding protein [Nevskiaceae bacterium]|nr:DNA-binding protein [Nevskiaceae bacterium]